MDSDKFPQWLKNFWFAPDYRLDLECKNEEDWYRELKPEGDTDYTYLLDYARRKYELALDAFSTLDTKADSLFRFSAMMAGILFAGLKALDIHFGFPLIVAFLCFLLSMVLTIRIRVPVATATPVSIRAALDSVDQVSPQYIGSKLAASYHVAFSAITLLTSWKASRLRDASYLFLGGLFLMFLGLLFN